MSSWIKSIKWDTGSQDDCLLFYVCSGFLLKYQVIKNSHLKMDQRNWLLFFSFLGTEMSRTVGFRVGQLRKVVRVEESLRIFWNFRHFVYWRGQISLNYVGRLLVLIFDWKVYLIYSIKKMECHIIIVMTIILLLTFFSSFFVDYHCKYYQLLCKYP